jgi:hypothetical protein
MAYELKAIVAANQAVQSRNQDCSTIRDTPYAPVAIDYSTYIPLLCRISCRVVRRINRFVPLRPKPRVHSMTFLLWDREFSPRTFSQYSDVVSTLLIRAARTGLRARRRSAHSQRVVFWRSHLIRKMAESWCFFFLKPCRETRSPVTYNNDEFIDNKVL